MHLGIAADHAGFDQKQELLGKLRAAGHEVTDFGALQKNPDDDFPDFVVPLARAVAAGTVERGVAVCGSGIGASVCADKVPGVRAAEIHDDFSARQGVEDDDMNVICLGGRTTGSAIAWDLVQTFVAAKFNAAERHVRRVGKIAALETGGALASLRAIPGMVVIRPCDENETAEAYRCIIALKNRPAALVCTRQDLPVLDRTRCAPASGVARGGYVLLEPESGPPRVILIGSGSEVHLCVSAYETLAKDGIAARVVSMPSWELFERQEAAYKESVLPSALKARVTVEEGYLRGVTSNRVVAAAKRAIEVTAERPASQSPSAQER
jgi:ribose 5-phosphate isomerase B